MINTVWQTLSETCCHIVLWRFYRLGLQLAWISSTPRSVLPCFRASHIKPKPTFHLLGVDQEPSRLPLLSLHEQFQHLPMHRHFFNPFHSFSVTIIADEFAPPVFSSSLFFLHENLTFACMHTFVLLSLCHWRGAHDAVWPSLLTLCCLVTTWLQGEHGVKEDTRSLPQTYLTKINDTSDIHHYSAEQQSDMALSQGSATRVHWGKICNVHCLALAWQVSHTTEMLVQPLFRMATGPGLQFKWIYIRLVCWKVPWCHM